MEERLTFLSEGTTPRKNLEVMQEAIKEAGARVFEVFFVCLGEADTAGDEAAQEEGEKGEGCSGGCSSW